MNAIIDLTARAVSFITSIQTTLLRGTIILKKENKGISILNVKPEEFRGRLEEFIKLEKNSKEAKKSEEDSFSIRSIELLWISKKTANDEAIATACVEYATFLSVNLLNWIYENKKKGINYLHEKCGNYPTPFEWRDTISKILYTHPDERLKLATALQYMPIQILLALGKGKLGPYNQRILQIWKIDEHSKNNLLSDSEIKSIEKFTSLNEEAEALLQNDDLLLNSLILKNVPLSFEQVFTSELKEIETNRERRISEQQVAYPDTSKPSYNQPMDNSAENDPYEKAKQMKNTALAFSGGGIRSATFNLGILQGLARKNLISKFDYLSMVSGGGYIGSWLAAWIKRDGSVVKVSNRLCPDKSQDPLGEELRPIKWLRMFSNYFAPNASIMSADSWTIGVTWLRNTLLNQVIIFFMLLSVLFFGNLLFVYWSQDFSNIIYYSRWHVLLYSVVFLIPVSLLAGFGMSAYVDEKKRWPIIGKEYTNIFSVIIMSIAFIGAYFLSAWLSSQWFIAEIEQTSFSFKIHALMPAAYITFASLTFVALIGKYVNCIQDFIKSKIVAWFILIITAAITAAVSLLCLALAWTLLQRIGNSANIDSDYKKQIEFILGFPIVLEVFSVTLVARMAFLGRFFPDERREWWGRMGAYIHRTSFLWILIAASVLLGQHYMNYFFNYYTSVAITTAGGWAGLILSAVKAAFSSQTSGTEKSKSLLSSFLNIFGLLGPYLFALGLLIFLPGLIKPICSLVERKIFNISSPTPDCLELPMICIILFCFFVALLLSMQVGVNEFSMHHFYRNRLVRAYLGATRRHSDRQKTVNPFTGFDKFDDEKLSKMTNKYGYYGPYPILNAALNASQVTDLARQDRKAESFIFSPLFCGFNFGMVKAFSDIKIKSYDYAYRQTENYAFKDNGPGIGTAMAISGAAVNPNQGYHSSAATAFLLTIFNVQMGRWIGNPRKSTWRRSEPRFGLGYIFSNLVGKTSTRSDYVALSDGGHFDNMGLYELVRRKCTSIILCDAEQDGEFTCEGFANAIRRCRIDFGADIKIDISKIVNRKEGRFSEVHYAFGDITYAGDAPTGKLLYIKSSIKGDEPVDVYEYSKKNETFPHQTTADQFFDEQQFESYRKLGIYIIDELFEDKDHDVIEKLKSFNL